MKGGRWWGGWNGGMVDGGVVGMEGWLMVGWLEWRDG